VIAGDSRKRQVVRVPQNADEGLFPYENSIASRHFQATNSVRSGAVEQPTTTRN